MAYETESFNRSERGNRVAMVRHELPKPSEPFITDQTLYFAKYQPVFVARALSGSALPMEARAVDMAGMSAWKRYSYPVLVNPTPLVEILRREEADVVHAHFGPEGVYSRTAARRLGLPHIVSLYGYDMTVTSKALLVTRRASFVHYALRRRQLLRGESTFICVSEYIRNRAVEFGLDPSRSVVIPVGVDTVAFAQTPVPAEPHVVHVARLVEKKGTRDLIQAFKTVSQKIAGARLIIVGDGPLRSELVALVERLGLSRSVDFRGTLARAESIDEIRKGAVFCLPSVTAANGDQEGLPQVILEAGALGRPVVATFHSGIPEGVVEGLSALLVPEGAPKDLASALISVLSDSGAGQRMGDAGRKFVVENYDLRSQTAKLEAVYESHR
ncbi:colanic acid/amylovoran biosynthesis glycosyltransferase [Cryobacterium sp. MP_3.1]|uniref:glycosyltransferase n=1 Tax=Cryobacterium sp. MP_3.1 TaxID=3071711 RepID=UPI002DF9E021|nr:colanic acid/amylovoran biosynthesis glycosyltransferase [Cryobacterium sp. MP_3.1]